MPLLRAPSRIRIWDTERSAKVETPHGLKALKTTAPTSSRFSYPKRSLPPKLGGAIRFLRGPGFCAAGRRARRREWKVAATCSRPVGSCSPASARSLLLRRFGRGRGQFAARHFRRARRPPAIRPPGWPSLRGAVAAGRTRPSAPSCAWWWRGLEREAGASAAFPVRQAGWKLALRAQPAARRLARARRRRAVPGRQGAAAGRGDGAASAEAGARHCAARFPPRLGAARRGGASGEAAPEVRAALDRQMAELRRSAPAPPPRPACGGCRAGRIITGCGCAARPGWTTARARSSGGWRRRRRPSRPRGRAAEGVRPEPGQRRRKAAGAEAPSRAFHSNDEAGRTRAVAGMNAALARLGRISAPGSIRLSKPEARCAG